MPPIPLAFIGGPRNTPTPTPTPTATPTVTPTPTITPTPTPAATIYNFFVSSAPAGISTFTATGGSYTYTWSSANGLITAGDASTSFVYTVQPTTTFTGNYLFQLSFYNVNSDNCADPGIAIWDASNSRTSPTWNWGPSTSRIAAQNNCSSSLSIYGKSNTVNSGSWIYSLNTWYTLHFYHEPTLSRCRYKMTQGQDDWNISGPQIATEVSLNEFISGSYYFGIGSDNDGGTLSNPNQRTAYSALRIFPL